jgi:hypothetical protein
MFFGVDVKVRYLPTVQYSVVEPKIILSDPAPRKRKSELRLRLQSRLQIVLKDTLTMRGQLYGK